MGNNSFIINGIDVSQCKMFDGGLCKTDSVSFNCLACADNPDCYFKQLTRKNAECEELKEQLEFLQTSSDGDDVLIGTYMDKVYRLSKALDEIEKICKFNFYQAIIRQSVDSSMSYLNKIKSIIRKVKLDNETPETKPQNTLGMV